MQLFLRLNIDTFSLIQAHKEHSRGDEEVVLVLWVLLGFLGSSSNSSPLMAANTRLFGSFSLSL